MYLMSACLCGVNCKYSGKNNLNEDCLRLFEKGKAILICPEQLGGLMTPRNPAEIQGNAKELIGENKGKVITNDGKDVTDYFIRGAEEVVKIGKIANVTAAILKEGSPSCGCNFVYDGTFTGKKIEGEGLTCHLLRKNGIGVISDEEYSSTVSTEGNIIYLSDHDYKRK